jgi:hypothetical protein
MTINQAITAAAGRHYMYYDGGWQRADGQRRWPTTYWAGRAAVRDARIAYVLEHAAGLSPARAAHAAFNCAPADGRWQDVARAMVRA